jgi:hypothetical protein
MAKITLGKRPDHITRVVSATMPDGTAGTIEVRYRYRTRVQFGELIDMRVDEARAQQAADEAAAAEALAKTADAAPPAPAAFSVAGLQRASRDANAAYIMDIATGWNLDEPFSLDSVTQLCDEAPGMATAIINDYRMAITEGRLGN